MNAFVKFVRSNILQILFFFFLKLRASFYDRILSVLKFGLYKSSQYRVFDTQSTILKIILVYKIARIAVSYSETSKSHTCVAALGKSRHRRWESAKRYKQNKNIEYKLVSCLKKFQCHSIISQYRRRKIFVQQKHVTVRAIGINAR